MTGPDWIILSLCVGLVYLVITLIWRDWQR